MKNGSIIEFKNVYKSFSGHKVLMGVDIEIQRGETIVILGGSGIGKTVFLKLMLGIMSPERGHVYFEGKDVGDMEEASVVNMRTKMGMLFQGSALFDSLTVLENVAYPLREHFNLEEDEIEKKVAQKLSLVGLSGIEGMMPSELSGGMKKRVGLARAISADPDVILYDEPTTGLDPANTRRINQLIKELQGKLGVTSVVVTHDLESAFFVGDRVALIHEGKFAFVGTPDEARKSNHPVVHKFLSGEMDTGERI